MNFFFDSNVLLDYLRRQAVLIASTFQIIAEDSDDFVSVLNSEGFFDLEDGLQMKCAEKEAVDYIVTDNLKDFRSSKIPAIDISSALKLIQTEN